MSSVELPSGMAGDVRKIKGTEIAVLAEQTEGVGGNADGGFTSLLNGCWLRTLDKGPYPHVSTGDAKPNWKLLLKGDVLFGVVELRRISLTDGDTFDFDSKCEECNAKIPWSVKLSELPVRKLPAASFEAISEGRPFRVDIEKDGAKHAATFRLQTIGQEEPIARLMKQTKRSTATIVDVICAQIETVQGVNPDIKARYRFLSELSMGELFDLRAKLDEHDCGIDTLIEIRCQNKACGWEQEINLPLLGRRFFSPKKRLTKKADDDSEQDDSSSTSSEVSTSTGGASAATPSGGISTEAQATGG
jgi:hypothetical protein